MRLLPVAGGATVVVAGAPMLVVCAVRITGLIASPVLATVLGVVLSGGGVGVSAGGASGVGVTVGGSGSSGGGGSSGVGVIVGGGGSPGVGVIVGGGSSGLPPVAVSVR